MKRYLVLGVAALALAVPVAASAAQPPTAGSLAVQSCKAQQAAMGAATFKSTYGANAYGKCVSKATKTASSQLQAANTSCKAQQAMSDADFSAAHSGKTFDQLYGDNSKSKGKGADANAYGKCVAMAAQAASNANTQATVAAAKTCKADRAANKTTFASTYKSFGACVSQKSKTK
ncbi:MAG TPA: hypothetical protein VF091_02245 [Gaiellaceae bacterium]